MLEFVEAALAVAYVVGLLLLALVIVLELLEGLWFVVCAWCAPASQRGRWLRLAWSCVRGAFSSFEALAAVLVVIAVLGWLAS